MTNLTLQIKDASGRKKTISRAYPVPVEDRGIDSLLLMVEKQTKITSFWFSVVCGLLVGLILTVIFKR